MPGPGKICGRCDCYRSESRVVVIKKQLGLADLLDLRLDEMYQGDADKCTPQASIQIPEDNTYQMHRQFYACRASYGRLMVT